VARFVRVAARRELSREAGPRARPRELSALNLQDAYVSETLTLGRLALESSTPKAVIASSKSFLGCYDHAKNRRKPSSDLFSRYNQAYDAIGLAVDLTMVRHGRLDAR
jgi:hypothetical protein